MADLERQLDRWVEARLIDRLAAGRILDFERAAPKERLRWPALLAVGFGTLMLCAGILLFVAAHWDEISPTQRFTLVLALVAIFHVAAGLLSSKVPSIGVALHFAGTVCLGAGIFLAGQIFNLEEHWPGGVMLWALGALLAWLVLRQWPQAFAAALLVPAWLGSEWYVATEVYRAPAWNIAAQGFLLLAFAYMSSPLTGTRQYFRVALRWAGSLALLPFMLDVIFTGNPTSYWWRPQPPLPAGLYALGYLVAYGSVLMLLAFVRKKQSLPMFVAAAWIFVLSVASRQPHPEDHPWIYLWVALGACALCYWGVSDNRKLFINYGTAIFALDVLAFYFSQVLDKMGRSMGLILLGAIFLAGGWVLNRLRTDLISRAAATGGSR